MKNFHGILFILFLAACVSVTGCGKGASGDNKKIGVIHLVASHPDHILLREKFIEALKQKGYDPEVVIFDAGFSKYPD